MPRQNRVTPFGDIISTSARGILMGNRGTLHNGQGQITKAFARKAWISCLTEYKDRKLEIMAPGRYTQLFFLDEATALSAGHRPCATCRWPAFNEFTTLWRNLHPDAPRNVSALDEVLHRERYAITGMESLARYQLKELPDGAMVTFSRDKKDAWLKWNGYLYRWSTDGYGEKRAFEPGDTRLSITPPTVIEILSAGYTPNIHASVGQV